MHLQLWWVWNFFRHLEGKQSENWQKRKRRKFFLIRPYTPYGRVVWAQISQNRAFMKRPEAATPLPYGAYGLAWLIRPIWRGVSAQLPCTHFKTNFSSFLSFYISFSLSSLVHLHPLTCSPFLTHTPAHTYTPSPFVFIKQIKDAIEKEVATKGRGQDQKGEWSYSEGQEMEEKEWPSYCPIPCCSWSWFLLSQLRGVLVLSFFLLIS